MRKPSGVIVATVCPIRSSSRIVLRSVTTTPLICGDHASLTIRIRSARATRVAVAYAGGVLVAGGRFRLHRQAPAATAAGVATCVVGRAAPLAPGSCQRSTDSVPSSASTSAVRLSTQSPELQYSTSPINRTSA